MRLKDKVAIVTGSARGLGKLYAERFAKEGAKITVCDVIDCGETVKAIESIGGKVLSLKTDVTSEEDTAEMAKKTMQRFGRIDILVNNAAIWGGIRLEPFWEISVEEWDKLISESEGYMALLQSGFPLHERTGRGQDY